MVLLQLLIEMQSEISLWKGRVISGFCYMSEDSKDKTIDVVVYSKLRINIKNLVLAGE